MCGKIKLQVYTRKGVAYDQLYTDLVNPIIVNEKQIKFSSEAEHIGLLCSICGNGPTISARFSVLRKALAGLPHTGLARGHRANSETLCSTSPSLWARLIDSI